MLPEEATIAAQNRRIFRSLAFTCIFMFLFLLKKGKHYHNIIIRLLLYIRTYPGILRCLFCVGYEAAYR